MIDPHTLGWMRDVGGGDDANVDDESDVVLVDLLP